MGAAQVKLQETSFTYQCAKHDAIEFPGSCSCVRNPLSYQSCRNLQCSRETFIAVCSQHPQFLDFSSEDTRTGDDVSSTHESTASESSSLSSGSSFSSLRKNSVDNTRSSVGSAASSLRRISIESSLDYPLAGKPDGDDDLCSGIVHIANYMTVNSLVVRRACRYDCYCECHANNSAFSSKRLAKLGELKKQCTDSACQGVFLAQCKTEAPFVSFRKALSHLLLSKSLRIRYNLNTFRMVSDAMRYVKHGNLEKLKACIDTGEATVWDTAPDGWSLLHVGPTFWLA